MGLKLKEYLITVEDRDKYRVKKTRIIKASTMKKALESFNLDQVTILLIKCLEEENDNNTSSK